MHRIINYSFDGYQNAVSVELNITDSVKIPESAINKINKALMITMNYLIENMERDKEESVE